MFAPSVQNSCLHAGAPVETCLPPGHLVQTRCNHGIPKRAHTVACKQFKLKVPGLSHASSQAGMDNFSYSPKAFFGRTLFSGAGSMSPSIVTGACSFAATGRNLMQRTADNRKCQGTRAHFLRSAHTKGLYLSSPSRPGISHAVLADKCLHAVPTFAGCLDLCG